MANKRQEKKLEKEQNNKNNFISNMIHQNENVRTTSTNNQKPTTNTTSNNAQPNSQVNTQANNQVQNNQSKPSNQDAKKKITNTKGKLNWSATIDIKVLAVLHGLESEYHLSNVSEAIQLLYTHNLKSLINHGKSDVYNLTKAYFLTTKTPKARKHYLKFYSHLRYNRKHNIK